MHPEPQQKVDWTAILVLILMFLALIGISAKMVLGQQTPVGTINPYHLRVIGFTSGDCVYCPSQRAQWKKAGVVGVADEFVLQQIPKAFEIYKVTGTPTTIVMVTNGTEQHEAVRFKKVVSAEELKESIQFIKNKIADGYLPPELEPTP